MANENKLAVVAAIWDNPERAFNCQFRQRGRYWENVKNDEYDESGKIRLAQTKDGGNVMVFYNGGSRQEKTDVFTYLDTYVFHAGGFKETLQRLADIYGVDLKYSTEEKQALARAALAREVAASFVEALRLHPDGATARYLRDVRGLNPDGKHFGELTKESIAAAKESLKARGKRYDNDDFKALGLTEYNAERGFNCVIPYYVNGSVRGFVLRNTDANAQDRYRYSEKLGRGGYCDTLIQGEPAVMVEGQFDAVRLIQAGIKNVIAMGGKQIGEDIAHLLRSHGIREVTYIPDWDVDKATGERDTKPVLEAIKAFKGAQVDGEKVLDALYIADLPVSGTTHKVDADSFGKEHGNDKLADVVELDAVASWAWELSNLITWANKQDAARGTVSIAAFRKRFLDIYNDCNPFERQNIRDEIADDNNADKKIYELFGVTPQALKDVDEWRRNDEYRNRIKDGADALNKAVQDGASPERIAAIVRELNDAQATNTRDEWNAQLSQTFADELKAIEEQPDTLKTKWEIGTIDKQGTFRKHDNIEFYPADIEVFCAPTSHGKTMILFQSAMDLIKTTNKTYLYVSCEENKRQLLERALNVYIDIPTTDNGKTSTGEYCFKAQTRKKTIKAAVRGDVPPYEYSDDAFMGDSKHYNALKAQIQAYIRRYETDVFPRLKLIHTEGSIESICANIIRSVEEYRAKGVDVGGVFVDYMQLLTTENRNYSRHDELKDICKALHNCATLTELPIVVAAQLNREVLRNGIDAITVANIGEGADIERIAHDIYLVWQVDKTQESLYKRMNTQTQQTELDFNKMNYRSNRLYTKQQLTPNDRELKTGYIYIERMKARDGKTEGWGLLPYDGERGFIDETDKTKMNE